MTHAPRHVPVRCSDSLAAWNDTDLNSCSDDASVVVIAQDPVTRSSIAWIRLVR